MQDTGIPGTGVGGSLQPVPAASEFRIALTSCATQAEAERIARSLVENQLAACVNLLPAVTSIYRWQERIESSGEVLLFIKTSARHLRSVEESIAALHSYSVPEFLVLEVCGGNTSYLEWLSASLK